MDAKFEESEGSGRAEILEAELKKRKRRPKFDENSLIRPSGLTALKQNATARNKTIARGREAQYVRQLMREYHAWGYDMVPWLAFEDMINRCQKLRGKKAVQEIIQSMRDDEAEVYVQRKYGELTYKRRRAEESNYSADSDDGSIFNVESDSIDGGVDDHVTVKSGVSTAMIARNREEALKKKRDREAVRSAHESSAVDGNKDTISGAVNELHDVFEDENAFFDDDPSMSGPTDAELEVMMEIEGGA